MKKISSILAFFVMAFSVISCDMDSRGSEQKYDMVEYIVNSSNWAKCQTQMATYPNEPTKADINHFERWIVLNANPQVYPMRDLTRKEITDVFLDYTSFSRDQINTLFGNVNSIGKYIALLTLQGGNMSILFIEKI